MQHQLLPSVIDDYVGSDDPVRAYDAFVDALNLKALGFSMDPKAGADEYLPQDILKLIIYGPSSGIRSSRKLERACYHNLSFQWITGGQKPDYRTIARFRSKNKEQIKQVLKQCVRICIDLDLIEGNTLFTDGSKFRANASNNKIGSKERGEKQLEKIHEKIDRLMDESEKIDKEEDDQQSLVKLKQEIKNKEQLVKQIQDTMSQVEQSDQNYVNLTDSESVKAKGRQGTPACHNVKITTDKRHGLIVHGESVSQNNDNNLLKDQLDKSSENLGKKPENACADSGYSSVEDLAKIDKDIRVVVPSKKQTAQERGKDTGPFDKEKFEYDQATDEYVCPDGQRLKCIAFNKEQQNYVYRAALDDCQCCPYFNACTSAKNGRTVTRSIHEDVKERLEDIYESPEGQEIYQYRKQKAELSFGHMKRTLGAGQFMLRGKEKVDAEISVLSTCFNIARMITIIGIPGLIARLNGGLPGG
jgi:transposase